MAKKKRLNSLSDLGGFVFSTNENEDFSAYENEDELKTLKPEDQYLEAHFSNKGRGGKTATVITGFQGSTQDCKALAKELKTKLSIGGTVKDGEIVLQGKHRDKIMTYLKDKGYHVKRIGG